MEKYDSKAAALLERSYQTPEIVNQRLRTLEALALTHGERVLDAGCGTGLLLEQEALLVGADGVACGIDASEDMLAHARRRCDDLPQVRLHQGSVEALPFDDAAFDAMSCTQTLLYVDRLEPALAEYYRVLRPRGRLVIVETDWRGAIMHSDDAELTRRVFDAWDMGPPNPNLPRRLRPLLARLGFEVARVEAIPLLNAGYSEHSFSANMLENYARNAQRRNVLSEAEAKRWLEGIRRLIAEGEYFFSVNRFLFLAVK